MMDSYENLILKRRAVETAICQASHAAAAAATH
jgi:hypothetical protein